MGSCGCHPDYHELGVHRPGYRVVQSLPSMAEPWSQDESRWNHHREHAFVLTYAG